MKGIKTLALATILVAAVGFFVARRVQSQIRISNRPQFLMTLMEKRFDPVSGALTYEESLLRASRHDAVVQVARRAHPIEGWVEMRTVIDLSAQKRIAIDPLTESLTTYNLPDAEVARHTQPSASCGADTDSPRGKVAGYDVVRFVQQVSIGGARHSEQWLAPALNCLPLRESFVDDSTGRVLNLREAQFIIPGPPPDALFAIPQTYTERSPSQVFTEFARRFPGRHGAPPETGVVLDQAYQSHR